MKPLGINSIIRILLLAVMMATAGTATAQNGLGIDEVFERYGHAKGCKMVEMHNAKLRGYQLTLYKSLTYKKVGAVVEKYLKEDKRRAKKIREVVEDGKIVSGYYMMSPKADNINRYILFSNVRKNEGAIIYIEGKLSPDDIMKLCYSKW